MEKTLSRVTGESENQFLFPANYLESVRLALTPVLLVTLTPPPPPLVQFWMLIVYNTTYLIFFTVDPRALAFDHIKDLHYQSGSYTLGMSSGIRRFIRFSLVESRI